MVVRVTCRSCNHPLGVAIVGTIVKDNKKASSAPFDWSRRDVERLAAKAPISFDDVLDAHHFFSDLGADWSKHLPGMGKTA